MREPGFSVWTMEKMTTFSAPDKDLGRPVSTKSQLTTPLEIHGGQDLPLPGSPYTVFDGVVPQHTVIKGGFTAYDDQQGLNWNNIQAWGGEIATAVGDGLIGKGIDSGSWQLVAAGVVIDLAVQAWYQIANLNASNAHQLGEKPLAFQSNGQPDETLVWNFQNAGGVFGVGSWDYTLTFHVTRLFVSG